MERKKEKITFNGNFEHVVVHENSTRELNSNHDHFSETLEDLQKDIPDLKFSGNPNMAFKLIYKESTVSGNWHTSLFGLEVAGGVWLKFIYEYAGHPVITSQFFAGYKLEKTSEGLAVLPRYTNVDGGDQK